MPAQPREDPVELQTIGPAIQSHAGIMVSDLGIQSGNFLGGNVRGVGNNEVQILELARAETSQVTVQKLNSVESETGRIGSGDAQGRFRRIVEQKDATEAQRAIREINPSYYLFRTRDLFDALTRVTNQNASGEYYITDVFELLLKDGKRVEVVDAVPPEDVLSVNTPEQLAEVDAILRRRLDTAHTARSHA